MPTYTFTTQRTIEVDAPDETAANYAMQAELHPGEQVLSCEEVRVAGSFEHTVRPSVDVPGCWVFDGCDRVYPAEAQARAAEWRAYVDNVLD